MRNSLLAATCTLFLCGLVAVGTGLTGGSEHSLTWGMLALVIYYQLKKEFS